jgi:hypothetical protein
MEIEHKTRKYVYVMKQNSLATALHNAAKRIPLGPGLVLAMAFAPIKATAQAVVLGSDSTFAVLAGAGITVAGAVNTSSITGDIGTYPTLSVTGLGNVTLTGVNQSSDTGVMITAKSDLVTAFNAAFNTPYNTQYGPAYDLGGHTLLPGVYNDASSLFINGNETLTLNANGNPNAVWIFQAGSTLITGLDSAVVLEGGAQAGNVFWQVGSSATLGTGTDFEGTILASQSITDDGYSTVDGRLLAEIGSVTLDYTTINILPAEVSGGNAPDTGSTLLLLGASSAALFAFGRSFSLLGGKPA